MKRRLVSSKEVIAKAIQKFNIQTSEWIPYAGEMINSAVQMMGIKLPLEEVSTELEVENFKAELPCDFHSLIAVEYNGYRILQTTRQNYKRDFYKLENEQSNGQTFRTQHEEVMYNINNNYIYLTKVEEGNIILHYKVIPKEFDEELNVYYPCVPDVEMLKEALQWYIIKELLLRGLKHSVIDFNIAESKWTQLYPRAQNACKGMTFDERMNVTRLMNDIFPNTAINNTDNFYNKI